MFTVLFFLGVLIAGLVAHIVQLRGELQDAREEVGRLNELVHIISERMERL
jgi:hypothetical protein